MNRLARRAFFVAGISAVIVSIGACSTSTSSPHEVRDGSGPLAFDRVAAQKLRARGSIHEAIVDATSIEVGVSGASEGSRARFGAARVLGVDAPTAADTTLPTDGRETVELDRGFAVETLKNTSEGLEQTWTFTARPDVESLDLGVPIGNADLVRVDERGLLFRVRGASTAVRYGHGTWVGADGRRVPVAARFDAGSVRLRIPADVLESTVYPAVLDPLISVEYVQPSSAPGDRAYAKQEAPRIAAGTSSHLITWSDYRLNPSFPSVFAVVRENGTIEEQAGVRLGSGRLSGTTVQPAVAFAGGVYLVAWASYTGVYFSRVDETGAALDVVDRPLYIEGSPKQVNVTPRGGGFLISWVDTTVGNGGIRAMRVGADGVVLDTTPFWILNDAYAQSDLSVRAHATGHWAVFSDNRTGDWDVYAMRLDLEGQPLDAAPIPIVTRAGGQTGPDVAFSAPGTALVVWSDDTTRAIHGASVSTDGGGALVAGVQTRISVGSGERAARLVFDGSKYRCAYLSSLSGAIAPYSMSLVAPARIDGTAVSSGASSGVDIVARSSGVEVVYDQADASTLSSDIYVNTGFSGVLVSRSATTQLSPKVGAGGGRFLVAWVTPMVGGQQQLAVARVNPLGEFEDDTPLLIGNPSNTVAIIGVLYNGTDFLVVWNDRSPDPRDGQLSWRLLGARINAGGALINVVTIGAFNNNRIAADAWVDYVTYPWRFMVTTIDGDVIYDRPVTYTGSVPIPIFVYEDGSLIDSPWIRATSEFVYYKTSGTDTPVYRLRRSTSAATPMTALPGSTRELSVTKWNEHVLAYEYYDSASFEYRVGVLAHDSTGAVLWNRPEVTYGFSTRRPRVEANSKSYVLAWQAAGIVGQRVSFGGDLVDPNPATIQPPLYGVATLGGMANDFLDRTIVVYSRPVIAPGQNALRVGVRVVDFGTDSGSATGVACNSGFDCGSGFCVDGVCCDGACGYGATNDCQACAIAAGGTQDGHCAAFAGGTSCRASAGECDVAETCDGQTPTCPADAFVPSGSACGIASAGPCDLADQCSGSSPSCVSRGLVPSGSLCRVSAGQCDLDDRCDGQSVACADVRQSASYVCRGAAGPCDAADQCDGVGLDCPPDARLPAGTTCRATGGACDVEEQCDGSLVTCPPDVRVAIGTSCRPSAGDCDREEVCDGRAVCPPDLLSSASTVCREATSACDSQERCTGASVSCPSDAKQPDGASCDDGMSCNGKNTCVAGACEIGAAPTCESGFVCQEPSGACGAVPVEHSASGGCAVVPSASRGGVPWTAAFALTLACCLRVRRRVRAA